MWFKSGHITHGGKNACNLAGSEAFCLVQDCVLLQAHSITSVVGLQGINTTLLARQAVGSKKD